MTAPTRRQLMAGSLAAFGAAGAPAIAETKASARDKLDLLDYLPEEFRFLAYMRWLKEQPGETRLEFIAMCEGGGFETEAIDTFKRCLDLPA